MTITSALNNAVAGLRAAGRTSDVIATNISNATTPGYARRELEVSSSTVNTVIRITNPVVIAARREAQTEYSQATAINSFLTRLEGSVGTPDKPDALTNLVADFEARLLMASSRPDAVERLDTTVASAGNLVDLVNNVSKDVTQMRSDADSNVDGMVNRLNEALEEVEYLNTRIAEFNISKLDDSALQDKRQMAIDEIHQLVPVREAQRENGKVALYTTGGVILIDGSAREVEFTKSNLVTPYMSLSGGHLSGLSIDGYAIQTNSSNGGFRGGQISAEFAVRDELGTDAMTQIDAFARDLVERFQDPTVDPTLLPGDAGLFTDGGAAFDPLDEVGLAERLSLNAAVDPDQGGETWRIRDGMNAAVPGAVGQASLIDSLRDALNLQRTPASGDFGTGLLASSDIANGMIGRIGVQRLTSEQTLTFAATTFHEMSQVERSQGVDTDAELQRLIVVEQAYAANARVFDTVQNMMDTLMRLGA